MTETLQEEEDTSLDSFFAKKDKSKKPKKKKTKKSDETVQGMPEQSKSQGDDWKDFEERKEKDYSNLKIQNLQVMEESKEDSIEESDDKDGEDEDGVKKKGNDSTKWNIPSAPTTVQAAPEQPELPGTQNVVGGKYVPPSVKRSAMLGMGSSSASRKPIAAPDIQSKAAFPTLSAANQDLSTPNRSADFEVVKRGIRTNEARVDDNKPRLDLGNRYDSLRH